MMDITANDPNKTSWIEIDPSSDFSLQNLPFGVFKTGQKSERIGVAIGQYVLDLSLIAQHGLLDQIAIPKEKYQSQYLNAIMKYGKQNLRQLRNRISDLLDSRNREIQDHLSLKNTCLLPMDQVEMCMPVYCRDYTDFYSSIEHATNVGIMFRDPENALLPNWKHLPVAYHGRASSIVLSGTDIIRPKGQLKPNENKAPIFGPCQLLDFELEMAFITFDGKPLGQNIQTDQADDYIFGMVMFNDWSARDIQKWEYVPLGPFLAKNFASSISPWVVTLDALQPYQVEGPKQNPEVLPYLKYKGKKNIDINLEVSIQPKSQEATVVSKSNYKYMYWNMNQQLAHHTVGGCNISCGDIMASGTISGKDETAYGSMLELSWKGTKPLKLKGEIERKFIQDYDKVIFKGHCKANGIRVGFGILENTVLPAI